MDLGVRMTLLLNYLQWAHTHGPFRASSQGEHSRISPAVSTQVSTALQEKSVS